MNAAEPIVNMVREHGTEATIQASVGAGRVKGGAEEMCRKQAVMFARLVHILESKFGLRRGHVVSMVCAAEGIQEDSHAVEQQGKKS